MTLVNSTFAEKQRWAVLALQVPVRREAAVVQQRDSRTRLSFTTRDDDLSVQDCHGVITSLGNNFIGNPAGCNITLQLSDLTGDAELGTFTDDGTPGNAHYSPLPLSPVIDAGNNSACPKTDQIGQPRKPKCDIGAVEFR